MSRKRPRWQRTTGIRPRWQRKEDQRRWRAFERWRRSPAGILQTAIAEDIIEQYRRELDAYIVYGDSYPRPVPEAGRKLAVIQQLLGIG